MNKSRLFGGESFLGQIDTTDSVSGGFKEGLGGCDKAWPNPGGPRLGDVDTTLHGWPDERD